MRYFRNLAAGLLVAVSAVAQDGVDDWVTELTRKTDNADVALIQKIAGERTRSAAEGLVKAYDAMASIYMQHEIVRALAGFDGLPEAEQPAMLKLANIAGSQAEAEVRDAAIAALGQSHRLGKHFLKQLVDSAAPERVREQALAAHVAMAAPEDDEWYRFLWNPKNEQRKNADGSIQAAELKIRGLAFAGLAPRLPEDELVATLRRELDPKIRRAALAAMHDRNMPKTAEMAAWLLERVDFPGADRAAAARILVERDGAKAVPTLLELAGKRDVTPDDLRLEMGKLIAGLDDDATNKKIAKLIGKGKPHDKVFALQAASRIADPKVLKAIRGELHDKAVEVRRAAAMALAARRDADSLPDLHNMLGKPMATEDQRIAIDAISLIEQRSPKWLAELAGLTAHADRDVRNAALEQLAQANDVHYLTTLFTALGHDDWTTRLIAIDGLVALRDRQAVPRLIDRLEHEQGRMSKALGDALWQLTGLPFDEDGARWRAWWEAEGAAFQVITAADLAKAEQDRELRRLKQRTRSGPKFFGIRLETHRVIFVIDSSGSMLESVYGRYVGKHGAARIDVAKQELTQCIKNLDPNALFNVFAFSSGVDRWLQKGIGGDTAASRQAALTWVDRLGAAGGTNLYDSIKLAFADKDVDTIFVLSDGEPTAGEVIDPHRIREDVKFWNQHRRIKIHTIAVGGTFEVLEWLAADSGGNHVRIR